jgi:hypothetical protein
MAKFNLDEYELVEDRLKKFWKDYPNGRVNTEVVSSSADGTMVIVKAEMFMDFKDDKPVSTGLAQETKGVGGFANKEAWLENCESSAIGRALANWKYQGSKKPRPTQQEMKKVQPVEKIGRVKDLAIDKAAEEMSKEIVDNPSKRQQLEHTVSSIVPDETLRKKLMNETLATVQKEQGFPTKISEWTTEQMSTYINMIEVVAEDKDILEQVFGEVKDLTRKCPECSATEFIEDNREKKKSDPVKFGKIPSWSCNNYGDKQGCGWTGWGDTDCPTEWL